MPPVVPIMVARTGATSLINPTMDKFYSGAELRQTRGHSPEIKIAGPRLENVSPRALLLNVATLVFD